MMDMDDFYFFLRRIVGFFGFFEISISEQNLRIDIARIRVYNKACKRVCHIKRSTQNLPRGHSSLVEYQLPKLRRRVRFPLSAPALTRVDGCSRLFFALIRKALRTAGRGDQKSDRKKLIRGCRINGK